MKESNQPVDIKISKLEERAISIWGITLDNLEPDCLAPQVIHRFQPPESIILNHNEDYSDDRSIENFTIKSEQDIEAETICEYNEPVIPTFEANYMQNYQPVTNDETEQTELDIKPDITFTNVKRKRRRQTFLSRLTNKLVHTNNINVRTITALNKTLKDMSDNYIKIKEDYLKLERDKLLFEIEKFKYQNKGFKFEL